MRSEDHEDGGEGELTPDPRTSTHRVHAFRAALSPAIAQGDPRIEDGIDGEERNVVPADDI